MTRNTRRPRLVLGSLVSAGVTLGVLYLMVSLIASGENAVTEPRVFSTLKFVRVEPDDAPPPPPPRVARPSTPQAPPAAPPPGTFSPGAVAVAVGPSIATPPAVERTGLRTLSNAEAMALVKPQPHYPRRALERGLEGYVIVEFTVTGSGTVADVRVVEASHPLFERAALTAAAGFRYKPRVVDGRPVPTAGVRNRFTFEIDDL